MADNIFDLHSGKRSKDNANLGQKQTYAAALLGDEGIIDERLMIYLPSGAILLMAYADLQEVIASPDGDSLTLLYKTCAIILQGQYLGGLVELLQNNVASVIGCFDDTQFALPDDYSPIIRNITRQSLENFTYPDFC